MAIKNWSTTAASNATVDSINWAENQPPSTVNDSARLLMSDVRAWYNDYEWRDWGHTVTQTSATTFTVATDVTSVYVANQPIRCTDATTLYGKVASSSYSAPNTTVTVTLDSGALSASLTAVSLGQKPTGKPIDVSGVRDAVATTGNQTIAGNKTFTGNNTHSGTQTISGVTTMVAKSIWTAEGAAVASAADCNIWGAGDGNTVHVTGTTTISDWGTAPQAGAWMRVIFDGALTLTYNATTNDIEGGANVVIAAGDSCIVYANSTSAYQVFNISRNTNAEFTIASATTTNIGSSPSDNVLISGTTTITGLGTTAAGVRRNVRFSGALTLTYNATSLILPGAANITTAANDTGTAISLGSGNWIFTDYTRASGLPMKTNTYSGTVIATTSGTEHTFSGLPANIYRIHVVFSGVSSLGVDDHWIRIGDSGGIETTGYTGFPSNSAFVVAVTTDNTISGIATLTLVDSSTNTWSFNSVVSLGTASVTSASGTKSLSATLDRIQILTSAATVYDAGKVNIIYDVIT